MPRDVDSHPSQRRPGPYQHHQPSVSESQPSDTSHITIGLPPTASKKLMRAHQRFSSPPPISTPSRPSSRSQPSSNNNKSNISITRPVTAQNHNYSHHQNGQTHNNTTTNKLNGSSNRPITSYTQVTDWDKRDHQNGSVMTNLWNSQLHNSNMWTSQPGTYISGSMDHGDDIEIHVNLTTEDINELGGMVIPSEHGSVQAEIISIPSDSSTSSTSTSNEIQTIVSTEEPDILVTQGISNNNNNNLEVTSNLTHTSDSLSIEVPQVPMELDEFDKVLNNTQTEIITVISEIRQLMHNAHQCAQQYLDVVKLATEKAKIEALRLDAEFAAKIKQVSNIISNSGDLSKRIIFDSSSLTLGEQQTAPTEYHTTTSIERQSVVEDTSIVSQS